MSLNKTLISTLLASVCLILTKMSLTNCIRQSFNETLHCPSPTDKPPKTFYVFKAINGKFLLNTTIVMNNNNKSTMDFISLV